MGHFLGFFEGVPLEKPQEMPHNMFCPRKTKKISRTFKISGTLIVIIPLGEAQGDLDQFGAILFNICNLRKK